MSDSNNKVTQEASDNSNFNPDNIMVDIGGKQVPLGKINKPHHVVIDPSRHKPKINPKDFPDVEPEAKQREADIAEARVTRDEKKNE